MPQQQLPQTLNLRKYPVTGRLTRDKDSRRAAAKHEPLTLAVDALPRDNQYDLRLKVGTGQSEATYAYFERDDFHNYLMQLSQNGKTRAATEGFYYGFPSATGETATANSQTLRVTFEVVQSEQTDSPGLDISFARGRKAGAELTLTPAQYNEFSHTFKQLCQSSLDVEDFDTHIQPGIINESASFEFFDSS